MIRFFMGPFLCLVLSIFQVPVRAEQLGPSDLVAPQGVVVRTPPVPATEEGGEVPVEVSTETTGDVSAQEGDVNKAEDLVEGETAVLADFEGGAPAQETARVPLPTMVPVYPLCFDQKGGITPFYQANIALCLLAKHRRGDGDGEKEDYLLSLKVACLFPQLRESYDLCQKIEDQLIPAPYFEDVIFPEDEDEILYPAIENLPGAVVNLALALKAKLDIPNSETFDLASYCLIQSRWQYDRILCSPFKTGERPLVDAINITLGVYSTSLRFGIEAEANDSHEKSLRGHFEHALASYIQFLASKGVDLEKHGEIEVRRITIEGYSDQTGAPGANIDLSRDRAADTKKKMEIVLDQLGWGRAKAKIVAMGRGIYSYHCVETKRVCRDEGGGYGEIRACRDGTPDCCWSYDRNRDGIYDGGWKTETVKKDQACLADSRRADIRTELEFIYKPKRPEPEKEELILVH